MGHKPDNREGLRRHRRPESILDSLRRPQQERSSRKSPGPSTDVAPGTEELRALGPTQDEASLTPSAVLLNLVATGNGALAEHRRDGSCLSSQ